MIDIPVHPAAAAFPLLGEDAITGLENDIKLNGLLSPVLLWNGAIIDGRNRYIACVRAGIKPKTKAVSFADDAECIRFIVSTNIHRRHLTESQRASIADELAQLDSGVRADRQGASKEAPSISQSQAADMMQVSRASVQRAREVREKAPDLAAQVKAGTLKVTRAATIARERIKPQTDPNQAADSVIDASEKRAAEGDTARGRTVVASMAKLDPTELTFFRPDFLRILGVDA